MISFHTSVNGAADYLDLGDGNRFYLRRDEARRLAAAMTAVTVADVECRECQRLNGVHATTCPVLEATDA